MRLDKVTKRINLCPYGGGQSCERQGGSGESSHGAGYVHPVPTITELGQPVGDCVTPLYKGNEYHLSHLESFFEDGFSKSVLGVSLDTVTHALDVVKKSLYDFDLDSEEGVTKLLELLPVMDREILADIAGEIWPGYPAQDLNPKLLRLEIKGYLMDYLDGHGTQEAETVPEGLGESAGAEEGGQEEGTPEEGAGGDDDETASAVSGASDVESSSAEGATDDESAPGPGAEA
jgi:hypothetical protein